MSTATRSPHSATFNDGAHIRAESLIGLSALAKQLPTQRQRRVLNQQAGTQASSLRGRGIDFSEVRSYQHGDDIRHMDWRVTARSGEPHIKLFTEERDRPVMVVCDLRADMRFGTRRAFKSVLSADVCALISWATIAQGDRLGALLFNDDSEFDLRPKANRQQALRVCHELANLPASEWQPPEQRFADVCAHLRRITRPGTRVYFMSDWSGMGVRSFQHLYDISRHNDLIGINIYDALERELPPPGLYPITDGQNLGTLNTLSQQHRSQHQHDFDARQHELAHTFSRLNGSLINIATDDDPLPTLQAGLGLDRLSHRQRRHR